MRLSRRALKGWLLLTAGLAVASLLEEDGLRRYLPLRDQVTRLEERNRVFERDNAALRGEIEGLRDDPEAWERAAREELGYVRADEVVFYLE